MDVSSMDFLMKLLETPSPSGFEKVAQDVWREYVKPITHIIGGDSMGNVWARYEDGAPTGVSLMVAGHCDEIGIMVTHATAEGYLHFDGIGGINPEVYVGAQVRFVHSGIVGVVGCRPVHLIDEGDGKKKVKAKDLYLDIGAADKEEALNMAPVGCAAVPNVFPVYMGKDNKLLSGRGLDNMLGSFVAAEALRICRDRSDAGEKLRSILIGLSSVQEELGFCGAKVAAERIQPHAAVVVDVTFATDTPDEEDKKVAGDILLGKGPVVSVGPRVSKRLSKILVEMSIPHQVAASPGSTGTDADAISLTRSGIPTAVLSIPVRYMHTPVETCHLEDVENAAKMVANLAYALAEDPDLAI